MKRLPTGLALVALACTFGLLGGGITVYVRSALASRNSAGTYSLATSPVTTLQTISTSLWNNTFNDLATGVTDSLDRNGRGGMLAALRGIDGTLAAPALSWTSETGSGLWRNGAGDIRMSVLGALRQQWTATGTAITGTTSSTGDIIGDSAGANTGTIANGIRLGSASSGEGIASKRSAGGNQNGLDLYAGSAVQLQLTNAGAVKTLFPLTIGSIGTAIASYQAKRGVTGCTTAASVAAQCATTITWTTTFADTNYAPFCSCLSGGSGVPYLAGIIRAAGNVQVTTTAATATAAQCGTIDCVAFHD